MNDKEPGMLDPRTTSPEAIREAVREQYAKAVTEGASCCGGSSCCGSSDLELDPESFGRDLYGDEASGAGDAIEASLGCGVPTQVADLAGGETVLDLGSGAGADALICARRVGPAGRVIGLDMTDEMLDLARRNAAAAGVENIDFLKGEIEEVPLPDDSVDVVISNCVINLSADKRRVLGEAARVLRPGGRFAVSDIIADPEMDDATRADAASWTGCIAGALTDAEFRDALESVGFEGIEISETHRVHPQAASAIVRAYVPSEGPLVEGER